MESAPNKRYLLKSTGCARGPARVAPEPGFTLYTNYTPQMYLENVVPGILILQFKVLCGSYLTWAFPPYEN